MYHTAEIRVVVFHMTGSALARRQGTELMGLICIGYKARPMPLMRLLLGLFAACFSILSL